MKILSISFRQLNYSIKKNCVTSSLVQLHPDMYIQETHNSYPPDKLLQSSWFPYQYIAPGISKSRGVVILLYHKGRFQLDAMHSDDKGCYIFIRGRLDDRDLIIASIYTPNVHQLEFLRTMVTDLTTFARGEIEDLNFIAHST